jgi:hypothetical protein
MGRLLTLTEIARKLDRDTRNIKKLQKLRNIQPIAQAAFRGKLGGLFLIEQFEPKQGENFLVHLSPPPT